MNRFLFTVLMAFLVGTGMAQVSPEDPGIGMVEYEKELSFGGGIHSRGWFLSAQFAKYIQADKRRLFKFGFSEIRHPKEQKQSSEYNLEAAGFDPPRQYAFGKSANFYRFQFSLGGKDIIGEKAEKNGISIQYQYAIGPALGFSKPYYLEIIESNDSPLGFGIVSTKYDADDPGNNFLERSFIYGSSGFWKGFGEMKIIPGLHVEGGFSFDWGKQNQVIKAVEVGLGGDYFFQAPQLLANDANKPVFFYVHLGLQLGKRW